MPTNPARPRRSAAETRDEIRRAALELFTDRGFDATSTRDIAQVLGINQSTLYYHFKSKDDIVRSLLEGRRRDLDAFLEWLGAQPRTPGLLREAALRWLDATTEEHVHAQRLALANQAAQRRVQGDGEIGIPAAFEQVIAHFTDEDTPAAEVLYVRTVFNAVGSVIASTFGAPAAASDVIAAARRTVVAMTMGD
ncbi:TetR/AcrR family transcriptional regulator [Streptomyces sp. NPDC101249]|uniref:TetR/AcrR family transcriptional regulator n=1 Tax=Streptomyces sp. NPDC101249 TaxID=3366140 RepID=UPI00380E88BE